MSLVKTERNSITIFSNGEIIVMEPYGKDIIRVRASKTGRISDNNWNLLPPTSCNPEITPTKNGYILKNGELSATVSLFENKYDITFFKNGREILKSRREGGAPRPCCHIDYTFKGGNSFAAKVMFEAKNNEHIYGLGQEQSPFFDKKGSCTDLIHYNTRTAIPVIYSSLGYGFFWNNPGTGKCEFSNSRTVWYADSAEQVDYLVFTGQTPSETLNKYYLLTGFPSSMPSWATGFWQSKLRYESQEDLLEIAREYKRKNIPIDAIVIDYFHWTEQGDWDFDPTLWPDPKEMCRELFEMNIHPVVSVWPTINPNSKNYKTMDNENMLVRTENGQYGLLDFYGLQTYADQTNPKSRKFVWEQVKNSYYSYGIKSYWLDATEPEIYPPHFDNLRFHIGNGTETALLYPYCNQKAFFDGLKSCGEDDVVLLTRSAYPGSQSLGTIVWNGDISSTFKSLHESIISGLSMAMSGIPWWNSDIGGFINGDTESPYFRELIVRWFQFGVFCPIMRLHGCRNKPENYVPRHPDINEISGGDNEIWSFGEENYSVLKDLILLRERLKPYIAENTSAEALKTAPIMRPMFFDFPNDNVCYSLSDQYMFGPDILFAPIYKQGEVEREVYLPSGKWVRTSNKKVYEGNRFIKCTAELNEFIAFTKYGADVLASF